MTAAPQAFSIEDLAEYTSAEPYARIAAATAAARAYCGWHVTPVLSETLLLDGPGNRSLFLPSLRVVSIEKVEEFDASLDLLELSAPFDPAAPWVTLVPGEYEWSTWGQVDVIGAFAGATWPEGWGLRRTRWSARKSAVRVTLTHGYDPAECADLKQVILAHADRNYRTESSSRNGLKMVRTGYMQETYIDQGWALGELDVLNGYKLHPRP